VPDLEISSVLEWFRHEEPNRPEIPEQPVTPAESEPGAEQALARLGQALDAAAARDPAGLATSLLRGPLRDELRALMGQLGFPRTLRLLDWLMQAGLPESDAILAAVLEPDPSGIGQYLQAILAGAARPTLLERIYALDRLAILIAACEPADAPRVAA
jgi:hypothetical protein